MVGVIAEDLIIDSKTQSFSETDNKIKFDGGVNVKYGDIRCVGDNADITVDKNNRLDTATIYNKPYAYEIKNNKKREVKANILKFSLLNKVIKAEGDTQTIVTEGKTPVAVINADCQEYDIKTNKMTASGSVAIKYKDMRAFADRAIISTNGKGDLKRIDLVGRAKIDQAKHHLIANHIVYDSDAKQMTAMGNATTTTVLDNGKEFILKANYQNYNQQDGIFLANGSVRAWYDDYFAKGPKVVAYPDKVTKKINEVFNTDEGARYVGEFAIGVNPYINKAMGDILFDEKIAGSIHFTPGACYEDAWNGNESAIHWDLVQIHTEEYGGGEIWFDDRLIRKNGLFVIPELKNLNPDYLK